MHASKNLITVQTTVGLTQHNKELAVHVCLCALGLS